jgi:signal transduction histidine kinase
MKKNTVFTNLARGFDMLKAQLNPTRANDRAQSEYDEQIASGLDSSFRLDSAEFDARENAPSAGHSQVQSHSRLASHPDSKASSKPSFTSSAMQSQKSADNFAINLEEPGLQLSYSDFNRVDLEKRAQLEVYQTLWLQDLIAKMLPLEASDEENETESNENFVERSDSAEESTRRLMSMLYSTFSSIAAEFNKLTTGLSALSHLRVSVTDVSDVREKLVAEGNGDHPSSKGTTVKYMRSRASHSDWSLSIRAQPGKIEFFLVPAPETLLLSRGETSSRLKSVLTLNRQLESDVWMADGLTADPDELFYISRALFKSLVLANSKTAPADDLIGSHILDSLEGEALRDTVKQIKLTEQNMAQKIVSQQEEIQNRIARDLHDAVIADIMSLKRGIASEKRLSDEHMASSLDQICQRLREICHDLAPRDLKDWGLQTVIDDLVERLSQRTGADCSFIFEGEMPDLPYQVQLHIYRIVQESLNNIEKYAQASRIIVQLEADVHNVKLTLRDNGRGFVSPEGDPRSKREGGTGLSGIKERTEMIRCFFPARLLVVSKPGKGSVTTLEVRV